MGPFWSFCSPYFKAWMAQIRKKAKTSHEQQTFPKVNQGGTRQCHRIYSNKAIHKMFSWVKFKLHLLVRHCGWWVDGWMFVGGSGIPSLKRWDCWKMNWLSPFRVQGLGWTCGVCVSPGTHRRWWLLDAKDTMNLHFKPTFVSYSADVPTTSIGIVVGRQRWMQHSIRTWIHAMTSSSVRWRFLDKASNREMEGIQSGSVWAVLKTYIFQRCTYKFDFICPGQLRISQRIFSKRHLSVYHFCHSNPLLSSCSSNCTALSFRI